MYIYAVAGTVVPRRRGKSRSITIGLKVDLLERLRVLTASRGMGQTLIKALLVEKLNEEER
jgi:hypothetical protein